MLKSSIPTKLLEFWAQNTPGSNVRAIPLTTATPGVASLDQGFPPANAVPVASGGIPPFIQDANGILKLATQWIQWMQAGGGLVPWDSAFASGVIPTAGYFNGAVVLSATTPGAYYVSTADNNTTNPDAGGSNWVPGSLYGSFTTGDVKVSYKTVADVGFMPMNDGSFGDGSSGGTTRQNADTQPLFVLLYQNMTDTWCPLQNSGGGSILRSSFGAVNPTNALAAYNAHSRLVLPAALGRAMFVAGAGAGLTSRALGQSGGAETIGPTQLPNITLLVNAYQSAARGPGPGDSLGQNPSGTQSGVTNWPGTGAQFLPPFASINAFVKL